MIGAYARVSMFCLHESSFKLPGVSLKGENVIAKGGQIDDLTVIRRL